MPPKSFRTPNHLIALLTLAFSLYAQSAYAKCAKSIELTHVDASANSTILTFISDGKQIKITDDDGFFSLYTSLAMIDRDQKANPGFKPERYYPVLTGIYQRTSASFERYIKLFDNAIAGLDSTAANYQQQKKNLDTRKVGMALQKVGAQTRIIDLQRKTSWKEAGGFFAGDARKWIQWAEYNISVDQKSGGKISIGGEQMSSPAAKNFANSFYSLPIGSSAAAKTCPGAKIKGSLDVFNGIGSGSDSSDKAPSQSN